MKTMMKDWMLWLEIEVDNVHFFQCMVIQTLPDQWNEVEKENDIDE